MEYSEVKKQSEEMVKRIIEYINNAEIGDDTEHLMMELAATFTTCASICLQNKYDDQKRLSKNLAWLNIQTIASLKGVYDGTVKYELLNEDGRYDTTTTT